MSIPLDIRTLFWVFIILCFFIGAVMLIIARMTRSDASISFWAGGVLLLGGGTMVSVLRDMLPLWIPVIAANLMLFSGMALLWTALRRFFGHARPLRGPLTLAVALTVGVVTMYFAGFPFLYRAFYASLALGIIPILMSVTLLRHARSPLQGAAWLTALMFLLYAGSTGWRAYNILQTRPLTIFTPLVPQVVAFTVPLVVLIAATAGFLMMTIMRLHGQLDRLATLDSLTETYNRRSFDRMAADEITRARAKGLPLSLLVADLDHFKRINDRYGHPAGDEVLREFARRARQVLRAPDRLGRYGGEEFVVILPETGRDEALRVADRLCRTLAERPVVLADGQEISVTVSIGLAEEQERRGTVESLYSAADRALYRAKQEGRNRVMAA